MLAGRRMSEEEVCPVRDELLGELYHADENCVSDLVATVAPDIRALLAQPDEEGWEPVRIRPGGEHASL